MKLPWVTWVILWVHGVDTLSNFIWCGLPYAVDDSRPQHIKPVVHSIYMVWTYAVGAHELCRCHTNGKYWILGEREFSRQHHQQVNTCSIHVNYRILTKILMSPTHNAKQLILMSHVVLIIHWHVIKKYVFLQKYKVNNENIGVTNVFNDVQMSADDV